MAASRFTTTRLAAMRSAPRDRLTVMIIGSSSGVSPTASATANRNASMTDRPDANCTRRTNRTRKTVSRMIKRPSRWMPRSNALGGSAARKRGRDVAEAGGAAGRDDQHLGVAAHHRRRGKQRVERVRRLLGGAIAGALLDRIGLAGHQRLVHMQIAALDDDAVRRHEVAGAQLDHVAGNELLDRDRDDASVAQRIGVDRDRAAQRVGGLLGAMLLHDVEHDREDDHDGR